MTRLLGVFVLFIIRPAELRPTNNDDLPTEEVFDYRIKNGYMHGRSMLKWRKLIANMRGSSGSIIKTKTPTLISDDNVKSETEEDKELFHRRRIKRTILGLQRRKKLSEFRNLQKNNRILMNTIQNDDDKQANSLQMTEIPQITDPDPNNMYDQRRERTYRWTFDADTTSNKHKPMFAEYIEHGMNVWARLSKVNFRYVPYSKDMPLSKYDILIKFGRRSHGDTHPFDGPGGETAHTIPNDKDDRDSKIEIHFDDDEVWQISTSGLPDEPFGRPGERPDFIEEVIHQVGHVFKFPHSQNVRSVMHKPLPMGERKGEPYALIKEDKQKVKKTEGYCWPQKIHAAYSDSYGGYGGTYMIIGPYTYQFKKREKMSTYTSVDETWPRPSRFVWNNFELIDEVFIHTDGNKYFFSGDEYSGHISTPSGKKGILNKKKIGPGIDPYSNTNYTGWPGLRHYNYIDGALRNKSKSYIFQDNLVYLWDSEKKVNEEYHYPKGGVADGWPKKIKDVFPGVPDRIDTVFRYYWDGKVYFFKDKYFYAWSKKMGRAKRHKKIPDLFRNICNVYMCTSVTAGQPCRSWGLTRENCGSFCES